MCLGIVFSVFCLDTVHNHFRAWTKNGMGAIFGLVCRYQGMMVELEPAQLVP